ncbi:hypothetical protein D4764_11G0001280 [Takifugu flavidus]|uniref:Uncharacterized protein n=1 Tax=Takifugu flavidus TaxID=433684 RepID=A0A5C6PHW2_9TELE|nr:hypothetical protein D4764_11G0001280 [Takifugu flavidus]
MPSKSMGTRGSAPEARARRDPTLAVTSSIPVPCAAVSFPAMALPRRASEGVLGWFLKMLFHPPIHPSIHPSIHRITLSEISIPTRDGQKHAAQTRRPLSSVQMRRCHGNPSDSCVVSERSLPLTALVCEFGRKGV